MCSPTWNSSSSSPTRKQQSSNTNNSNSNSNSNNNSQHYQWSYNNNTHRNHDESSRYLRAALEAALQQRQNNDDDTLAAFDATNNNGNYTIDIDWGLVNGLLQNLYYHFSSLPSDSQCTAGDGFTTSHHVMMPSGMTTDDDYSISCAPASQNRCYMDCDDYDDQENNDDDDMEGRQLVCRLLSHNPPLYTLQLFLSVPTFRRSIHHNPAAFFTASRYCGGTTNKDDCIIECMTKYMMEHIISTTAPNLSSSTIQNVDPSGCARDICPYPWLLSPHISVAAARGVLEAFPQGVWKPLAVSTSLKEEEEEEAASSSSLGLLDHFLWSRQMVARRDWDETLWIKFKLVLVAAEYSSNSHSPGRDHPNNSYSPVRVILERILARNGM
jgi:hypothetical protein